MRKLSIILLSIIALLLIAIAARAGDFFVGDFLAVVDVEPSCGSNVQAGKLEITQTSQFSLLIGIYVEMPSGDWVKVTEVQATKIGNIMTYPIEDQIIDFNQAPWFFDATVTNKADPAIFLWLDDSSFIQVIKPATMTCVGVDCDLAATNMQIEQFPCNLPLQVIMYEKD